ncbi:O-acyltransferase like protein-like [Diadema antillarum]|uniref:O-acyltransferase like protein-like n=1 Tax=Diadema antillarum TaxID=105358 RepID=UPI003A84FF54
MGLLTVCVITSRPTIAQYNPEWKRLEQLKRMSTLSDDDLFDALKRSITEQGFNFEETMELLSDRRKHLKFQLDEIVKLKRNARLKEAPSGKRFYVFADDLVSQECLDDVERFNTDLASRARYATLMEHSYGEPQLDVILDTWLQKFPGNIWLCEMVKKNGTLLWYAPFDGKYCYRRTRFKLFQEMPDHIGYGTCWPGTCTQEEIQILFQSSWFAARRNETVEIDCIEPLPWRSADIAFTTLVAFLALLVVTGTLYETFVRDLVLKKVEEASQEESRATGATNHELCLEVGPPSVVIPSKMSKAVGNDLSIDDHLEQDRDSALTSSSADEVVEGTGDDDVKDFDDGMIDEGFESSEKPTVDGGAKAMNFQEFGKKKPAVTWSRNRIRHLELVDGVLISFSMVTNCKKIFSAKKTKNTMASLNGIRVLSMFWVILGHTIVFYQGRIMNPRQTVELVLNYSFWAVTKADVSVDTFFLLSGLLVTHVTLQALSAQKLRTAREWALFYFHRWWRLTPVLMVAIGLNVLVVPHAGHSVWTDRVNEMVRSSCRQRWWTHPLYINNLYPWPNVLENMCFGLSWYLANDMQFYIISPVVIVLLYRKGVAGMSVIVTLMFVSLGAVFGISWYWGLAISGAGPWYNERVPDPPNADLTYAKPYTRIQPYLVGMALGYIIFKLKGKKLKLNWGLMLVGWCVALATLYSVVYGQAWVPSDEVSQPVAVFYLTVHRMAWGIGVAWIIFACQTGYGGPIAVLLEWRFWIPMARLTYCTYLIHSTPMFTKILSDQVPFHMTVLTISYWYTGNLVISYASGLVLSLLIEGPAMGLEKVFFGAHKMPKVKRN